MTKAEPIDLSIIDGKDINKLKKKHEKMKRVMDIIHENGLEKDEEFMEQINLLMEALIEEKE